MASTRRSGGRAYPARYSSPRLLTTALWLGCLVLAPWAPAVTAQNAQSTVDQAQADDILTAMRPLAREGQASAQYNMGVIYAGGIGVSRDYRRAIQWYRQAAEQGYARAQYNLGVLYRDGSGVARDPARARRWFERAAAGGEAAAQNNLAVMYARGEGVSRDTVRAVSWAARAARAGNAAAASNLEQLVARMPREKTRDTDLTLRRKPDVAAAIVYQGKSEQPLVILARQARWTQVLLASSRLVGWMASETTSSSPSPRSFAMAVAPSADRSVARPVSDWKMQDLRLSGQRWLQRARGRLALRSSRQARLDPRFESLSLRSSGWGGPGFR